LLLLLGATGAAHAGYAPQAEIDAAMRAAAVEAKAYGDEHSLIAGLQWAQARSVTDPLAAEAHLLQLLIRLREVRNPQTQTRAAVAALRDHAPQTVTDPVDPEQRGLMRPAFPIAGAARSLLRLWSQAPQKLSPAATPAPGVLMLTD